jgi:hypothetical protein
MATNDNYRELREKLDRIFDESLAAGGLFYLLGKVELYSKSNDATYDEFKQLSNELNQLNKKLAASGLKIEFDKISRLLYNELKDYVDKRNKLYEAKKETCDIVGVKKIYYGCLGEYMEKEVIFSYSKAKIEEYLDLCRQDLKCFYCSDKEIEETLHSNLD